MSDDTLPPVTFGEGGPKIGVVTGTLITDEGVEFSLTFDDSQISKNLFDFKSMVQGLSIFGPSEEEIETKGDPDELDKLAKIYLERFETDLETAKNFLEDARHEYGRHIHFLVEAREARRKEQQ
jgi:hypothetical protein